MSGVHTFTHSYTKVYTITQKRAQSHTTAINHTQARTFATIYTHWPKIAHHCIKVYPITQLHKIGHTCSPSKTTQPITETQDAGFTENHSCITQNLYLHHKVTNSMPQLGSSTSLVSGVMMWRSSSGLDLRCDHN